MLIRNVIRSVKVTFINEIRHNGNMFWFWVALKLHTATCCNFLKFVGKFMDGNDESRLPGIFRVNYTSIKYNSSKVYLKLIIVRPFTLTKFQMKNKIHLKYIISLKSNLASRNNKCKWATLRLFLTSFYS